MGRTTLAIRLKPEANDAGEHVIRVRITRDRKVTYWPLSMSVGVKHFNEEGTKEAENWVRRSYSDYKTYNQRIKKAYQKAEKAVEFFEDRDQEYSSAQVRDYLEGGGSSDKLLAYFEDHIAARKRAAGDDLGKLKTADGYVSTLKVLRTYTRDLYKVSELVSDEELDAQYWAMGRLKKSDIIDLKAWLDNRYAPNSVTSYLRNLRHVLYQAAEAGLVSYEKFPMRGVSFGVKRKKVDRLQEEEIEMLSSKPAPTRHRGGHPSVTSPDNARPLAMMMYLAHGARLGDAITWRVENYVIDGNEHRLRYTTGKNKKPMSVLLDEEAISLLAPYLIDKQNKPRRGIEFIFPYLPADFDKLSTQDRYIHLRRAKIRARQQIIRLGERIGLPKRITPHIMRHSFADMMRRGGVDLETRQNVLGHSDIKTTRNYEEQFDQAAVDKVSDLYKRNRVKQQ